MNKKDRNKIITTSIMFVAMLVVLFFTIVLSSAIISATAKEDMEAEEASSAEIHWRIH